MKETFQIPTPETLEALTGKELYDLWTSLHQKLYVPYTPKNKRLGSWLF